ncbi:hypothetical protein B566_EDAN014437 [Ephemera danica]|nr:hypothetical protein B566_EDAN014437 [Ephemera danica]
MKLLCILSFILFLLIAVECRLSEQSRCLEEPCDLTGEAPSFGINDRIVRAPQYPPFGLSALLLAGTPGKFVKNYAEIAHPLSELVKKGMPVTVQWKPECDIEFRSLKTKMITSLILAYADFK